MAGPWQDAEIQRARSVPLLKVLAHLADHLKEGKDYVPRDPSLGSRRFRLILTREKWLDELVGRDTARRDGGGAVDLAMYLTGLNFVQAVKACIEAAES